MPTRIFHDEDGIIRDEQEEEGCERHHIRSRWTRRYMNTENLPMMTKLLEEDVIVMAMCNLVVYYLI